MNESMHFPERKSSLQVYTDPSAVAAAESVKARIQSAYIMAFQKPRNERQSRDRILTACKRTEFARQAEYSKPIGGTNVNGPSIRFAELALREWGNIISEVQALYEDENVKRVRVSILDLETNAQFSKDITINKTVERKSKKGREDDVVSQRKNSYGQIVFILKATDEEMYTKEASWVSKIIRNEGLRLIPTDIIEEGMRTARETMSKNFVQDPDGEKKKILDAFSTIGVKPTDLEKHILGGQPVDTISPQQILELRNIYTAIKEGTPWTEFMAKDDPAQPDFEGMKKNQEPDIQSNQKPKKEHTKTTVSDDIKLKMKQTIEIDPDSSRKALIDIGRDSIDKIDSNDLAKAYLKRFDELLDSGGNNG